ncbi:MAG: type II secretion system F family protein [Lawsonibacter sp.]|nr:type II secretion system F family protein [Lawsonibacter sp.]
MPTYRYEGAYAGGERVTGVVEAVSQTAAVAQIRQSCEVVLSLKEVPRAAVRDPLARFQRISAKSLALTCRQFAIILKAGLPLVQTVDLVAEQCPDRALGRLLRQVSEDVSNGWSLSYSFSQRGERSLPVTFRETVRAGEESGDLLSSFDRMAEYYHRMNKTRESVVSALTYPAFVLAVAAVVVAIIMGYAVPTFTGMFQSMDVELPWVTVALIGVSNFFQRYALVLLGVMALAVFLLRLYGLTEKGGAVLAGLQLKLPLIGEVVRMSGASQFAHTMSTLLTAGMPILQAIEVSGRTMTNQCMSDEVLNTLPRVEGGRPLGECMSYARELPPMLVQMTAVGEATGSMESTLKVLAEYYDNEVEVRTKRALALLEPTIIVVLAIFVVFILMAVYLPMFSMYSAI